MSGVDVFRRVSVDLDAIEHNTRRMLEVLAGAELIAVVKANGYGHGALESARAALRGGAHIIATADLVEAVQLRRAGIDSRLLCWLHGPETSFDDAAAAGIEIGVSNLDQLERAVRAGADVHLKLETGLARNGASPSDWSRLFEAAAAAERAGIITVRGIMTHLANASADDDVAALALFHRGVDEARAAGLRPELVHAAASAAAFDRPEARLSAARIGIALYGLSPFGDERTSAELGLRPAMTLSARVAGVRRVQAGHGVSYDYTYRTTTETTLALVPLGYADGIPRAASNTFTVTINGRPYPQRGRVAMDQFVVEVGDDDVSVGDDVVVFGDPAHGARSAEALARAAGTINYEIVTRVGERPVREYRSSHADAVVREGDAS